MIQLAWQELRFAARALRLAPAFTATAVMTLALGIGAATAAFSVVSAGLLRQLPYANPDRLVVLWQEYTQRGWGIVPVSQPNFASIARQAQSFDGFVAVQFRNAALTGDSEPEMLSGAAVTPRGFQLLGVEAAVGRTLREADAQAAVRTAVLSDAFWRRRFGADRQIIGRTIVLDGEATTVVGVMPRGFALPPRFRAAVGGNPITVPPVDVWTPLAVDANPGLAGHRNLVVIARLAPGATVAAAREEAALIAPRLLDEFPGPANRGLTLNLVPLQEQVSGNIRRPLMLLLGAVTLVLLVACANVASMLMARAIDQRGEVALRAALGASRARLVGQALVESLVLSALGGTAGVLAASWLTEALTLSIEAQLPQLQGVTVDAGVLGFALLLTVAAAVIFGTMPALYRATQAPRAHFSAVAVTGGTVPPLGRRALVTIQAGLVVVLLAGAGVFARSFAALVSVDPGFDASRVVTVGFDLPATRYPSIEQRVSFHEQLVAALRTVPGVAAVGITSRVPLAGASGTGGLTIAGRDVTDLAERPHAAPIIIDEGYLETMGIRVVRGRPFNADDRAGAPGVALVNRRAAQLFWPGQDPIGQRVRPDGRDHWLTIVGVVEDVRQVSVATRADPALYWPFAQSPRELDGASSVRLGVVVRGTVQADMLLAAIRRKISGLDALLPSTLAASLDDLVAQSVGEPKLFSITLGLFAVCGLLVAATGLYGVLSHLVARRRREIGVRLALGAGPGRVLVTVLAEGIMPVAAGIAIGLIAAILIAPSLAQQLHDVSPTDGVALTGAALMLMTVALAACYLPARRAARLDPAAALRLEN